MSRHTCTQKGKFQHIFLLSDNQSALNRQLWSIDLKFDWYLDFDVKKELAKIYMLYFLRKSGEN